MVLISSLQSAASFIFWRLLNKCHDDIEGKLGCYTEIATVLKWQKSMPKEEFQWWIFQRNSKRNLMNQILALEEGAAKYAQQRKGGNGKHSVHHDKEIIPRKTHTHYIPLQWMLVWWRNGFRKKLFWYKIFWLQLLISWTRLTSLFQLYYVRSI